MDARGILAAVKAGSISVEDATGLLEALAPPPAELRLKVSPKGGVSLLGINSKWPVTLYARQWERVFAHAPQIKAFIAANAGKLSQGKPAAAVKAA